MLIEKPYTKVQIDSEIRQELIPTGIGLSEPLCSKPYLFLTYNIKKDKDQYILLQNIVSRNNSILQVKHQVGWSVSTQTFSYSVGGVKRTWHIIIITC